MKKVMFYCPFFYPENSGYANAFRNLVVSISEHLLDVDLTVVTPHALGDCIELNIERVNIIRLKPYILSKRLGYFLNDIFYAREISKMFKNGNYDLLVIETFEPAMLLAWLDRDIYRTLAVRIHATSETEYTMYSNKALYRIRKFLLCNFVFGKVRWFLSTNSYHVDFVKKVYFKGDVLKAADSNFFILPNPVSARSFAPSDCSGKIKLLILGRMDYLGNNQKGFLDFFYALGLLSNDVISKFEITVIGKGDLKQKLVELCSSYSNVKFIDSMPHDRVLDYLSDNDVVVLPSRYEGLSMFALEGLSTGNVCIFSKTGGLVDMIDGNGFFFEPQNIEELAECLTKASCLTSSELDMMKERSINLCNQRFSYKSVAEKFRLVLKVITDAKL